VDGTYVSATGRIQAVPPLAWFVGRVADFDGDEHADILWRNRVDGRNTVWFMNSFTRIGGGTVQPIGTKWNIVP
jgi:hypothetical protein